MPVYTSKLQGRKYINVLFCGNSKVTDAGDLAAKMTVSTSPTFQEMPTRFAAAGLTVTIWRGTVQAQINAAIGKPDVILINVGVNDSYVIAFFKEQDWRHNYKFIIDLLRKKYGSIPIYLMRVWGRATPADCTTLDTWISYLVAKDINLHLGPDERIFLENGDNGVTYTADGVHPNAAGYQLTADQWRTVLGF